MEVFHEKKRKNINCTWNYSSNNFNIAINIESVMGIIFIYPSKEFEYKNIILGLFSLNLILIIMTILLN